VNGLTQAVKGSIFERSLLFICYNTLMVQPHIRHVRKAKHREPFDYIVYFFMVATPLFELPQAYDIHSSRNAESVSIFTWGFFFVDNFVWLTYAIKRKLKPLIFMYSMYILVEASIVIGIILYS